MSDGFAGYGDGVRDVNGAHDRDGGGDDGGGADGEGVLRRALQHTAAAVAPSDWSAQTGPLRLRIQRQRRRRRAMVALGVGLPLLAVAAFGGSVLTGARGAGPVRVAPAASAPAHRATPTPTPTPTGAVLPVIVLRPGQRLDYGHGLWSQLTATGVCDGDQHGAYGSCKSVVDGNQQQGSVSLQKTGDTTGTLYRPLYIGSGRPVRMTATVGSTGKTYELRVATLSGNQGYAIGFGWGPPDLRTPPQLLRNDVTIVVYGADDVVLARS
ncbi:hypothetical protein [Streptacidiphilus sp. EB129]|uniref:hypothetical protein n=1 Tax=Streptacidiphilus sp. EB129 TaxID=3156262 RepID=UPI0035121FEC